MSEKYVVINNEIYYSKRNSLNLSGLKIKDISEIEGLDSCKDLEVLRLNGNEISEIKGLENLLNLQFLNLSENKIVKINGLERLTNLKNLDLSYNRIREIEGLENLINLEYLTLDSNHITEIRGIERLEKLKFLSLYENPIKEEYVKLLDKDAGLIVKILQAKVNEWKNSIIKFFCIHTIKSANLYHRDFKEGQDIDEDLFAGGISGIMTLIKEMTKSDSGTKVIEQHDKKIILESGLYITCILISTMNLEILQEKLSKICFDIELKFSKLLSNFMGRRDILFEGIEEIVSKYFG